MWQRTTTGWTAGSPATRRLRVLVESDDPALALSDFAGFTRAGIDVALCRGDINGLGCPLLRDEPCPLVAEADAILYGFGPEGEAILDAARRHHRTTPVVVRTSAGAATPTRPGAEVLAATSSLNGQIDVLRRAALAGRRCRPLD